MTLEKIKKYLISKIQINLIEIYDDSPFHNHTEKGLTHLRITIVSNHFIDRSKINR